jgi:hypothetical protein
MKWNNAEFTDVTSLTLLLMCSALCCRILTLALTTSNSFVQFVFAEIARESAWWGPVKAFLVLAASPVIAVYQNWNRLDSGSEISTTLLPRAASSGTLLQCFVFFTQNIH